MCGIVGYTGRARRARSSSRASSGSSTAATTRPASRSSTTPATCSSRSGPASWSTSRPRSPTGRPHAAIGLAHTRWATHGRPNDLNAHPHRDCTGEITVIHNGIIENFRELRDGLEARGHVLDLRDRHRGDRPPRRGGLRAAISPTPSATRCAGSRARTRSSSCTAARRDRLVGARKDVPLVVGLGDGESFLASDVAGDPRPHRPDRLPRGRRRRRPPAVGRHHHRPRRRAARARGRRPSTGRPRPPRRAATSTSCSRRSTSSPSRSASRIAGRIDRDRPHRDRRAGRRSRRSLRNVTRIELIACGSAHYASLVGACGAPGLDRAPGPGEHRLRVPLRPAAARRADAGHRRHPVGRDRRHDRADTPRARARLPGHRGDEHGRLGHHPRGRRGPVPAGRARRSRWRPRRRS